VKSSLVGCAVAVVAVAGMGWLAPGQAAATLLCDQAATGCPGEPQAYPSGTAIKASLKAGTKAVLKSTLGEVECSTSSLEGKTNAASGKPLAAEFSALSYGSCSSPTLGACEALPKSLPYSATIESSGEHNGTLAFKGSEVLVECGSFLHCVYALPSLKVTGGAPATLSASEVTLTKLSGFFCPTTTKMTVTYAVSAPQPVYVEE